ncbi:MAG TPA: peptide-methionine (S)-S-oxide reductase MsrA [Thermoplasmata archaeon]|nr:peptide-methionine (S)-S-oxide reductase MsrA [Thermoplasmata archaeon]
MADASSSGAPDRETVTLGSGCFWCSEAVFSDLQGVESVRPGYAGGAVANPSYEMVCTGTTGHAEVAEIVFDPRVISLHDLLAIFFTTHDPTTKDRQGNDVGPQYRSVIFYRTPAQRATAETVRSEIEAEKLYRRPIVTEIVPFAAFHPAEEYHREYFRRHPERAYCAAVIAPKVAKFRKQYAARLKPGA